MIPDYLKMAVSNLLHRKLRSWLTLIGIFIGIAAVVALISLGQGLQQAITAEFLELGADKMQITAKTPFGAMSDELLKNSLRDRDLRVVEQTPGIKEVTTFDQTSSRVVWAKDQVAYYPIIGSTTSESGRKILEDYFTLKMSAGRGLRTGDDTKAVIGYELTNPDKLERPMKLGDKLNVNGTVFEVVGIYDKMGDPMVDSAIFISTQAYQEVYNKEDIFDGFILQVEPGLDAELVAEDVRQSLRRERNLKEGDEDFDVQTPQDLVDSFNTIFNIVQFVIYGIAAISLLVGGVGIMNTMYTSVLERTKEIGIMKAIGATNNTVLLIFLIESGLLGLIGGIMGVLIGLGLAKATEYIGQTVLDTTLLHAWFSWWLVLGAVLFACVTGIGSGVLPARQASKQKPVDSLRYE